MTLSADPVVGIDVSKDHLDVVFLADDREEHKRFTNHPTGFKKLNNWIKRCAKEPLWICLEATGIYGDAVANFLHEADYRVSIVNPAQIKAFAQSQLSRNKTDKLDAKIIAQFARVNDLRQWTPPPPEWVELRAIVRHLQDLKDLQQREKNRLSVATDATVRQSLQAHIQFIAAQIAVLRQTLDDHFDQYPDLKTRRDLLTSIPGIGDWTAYVVLTEVRDLTQFTSPKQLVAYAGLNPQHRQSGRAPATYTPISKIGNARLRQSLFMAALPAIRFNPIITPFFDQLKARGKHYMVARVAVMRKLLHLIYGVLKHQQPFDPNFLCVPT